MNGTDRFESARLRYVSEFSRFKAAEDVMCEQLVAVQVLAGVRADVGARAKEISSFIKKLHLKRDKYQDPWSDVTDKLGGRMIVGTLPELARLASVFEDVDRCPVEVLSVEDKSAEADEGALFYPGIHVQVVVPGVTTSDGERIECEVQLRTKAQDLWSVPSHSLIYKPVIEPTRDIRRRVLRLSVLVEIFDQEVEQAMTEVEMLPSYAAMSLLRAAEAEYLAFASERGDYELSLDVLAELEGLLPDAGEYGPILHEFAETHREKLKAAYEGYGAFSEWAGEWAYWLVSQPESLVIWQQIETAPMALAAKVRHTDLRESVSHLYEIWGRDFPIRSP